ncbi:MAG: transporter substrate-binding domain-containing protein [Desulfobacterium sp.]
MRIDLNYRFRTHKWHFFLSIIFLMIAVLWGDASADQDILKINQPLKSACETDYPPFCFVGEDDQAKGFSVELLEAALKAMGRDVTFDTGPWVMVRSWLEEGDVQALPLVGRTPEREFIFDFTFPYMSLHGAIVVRADTTNIHNLEDLRGRQVAVMKGDNAEEFLERGDRGIKIHSLPTFNQALKELSQGFHDAVVIQQLVALRLVRQIGLSNLKIVKRPIEGFRQDFCFAVKEGDRETLALLNEGLALVMADGRYRHLHAKWFAALQLPSHNRIVIGGDDNYPPFEYLDENGLPAGFIVDLTRGIAREVGLDVTFRLGPWGKIVDGLKQGYIDAIQAMFYSPDRDLKFDFTQPHSVNNYVIAVRKGQKQPPTTLAELKGRKIVVQNGDIMHEFAVENGLEDGIRGPPGRRGGTRLQQYAWYHHGIY